MTRINLWHSTRLLFLGAVASLACGVVYANLASMPELPNATTNPGALNPEVNQSDIYQTICKRGWSRSVRPPFRYTNALKHRLLRQAGLPGTDIHDFELDHLVSLELGGAPWDPRNLWLEPLWGKWNAHVKDQLENKLNHLVCRGQLSLADAQYMIATDWIAAYKRYIASQPKNVKKTWAYRHWPKFHSYHTYRRRRQGNRYPPGR